MAKLLENKEPNLINDFNAILSGINRNLIEIQEKLDEQRLILLANVPSGTIEVYGVITSVKLTRRSGIRNVSLREEDDTHRWLRISATVSAPLEEGQQIWVRGVYRVEKRNRNEFHIIYVERSGDIKSLENG